MKRIKALLFKNQLISGSFVMMIGSLTAGFGNYLYHLLMGRMLGPVDYGILASLISLLYLLSIPMGTLNLVIVKFVSKLKGQKKLGEVVVLFKIITQKALLYGLVALLLFLISTPFFASFLHLDSTFPLFIVGIFALMTVITMVNRATLQGLLRFGYFSASNILEMALKVGFAVLLVSLGLKVNGALFALIIGGIAGYFFTLFSLRFLPQPKGKEKGFRSQEMFAFAIPVFFSTLSFTSLYTTDIILVRHFLVAQEAGFYAALATLGKIIFFASSPIVMVMFPMISEKHANGKKYINFLSLSLGLVFLVCLGVSGVYFLFPELMVNILYGSQYLSASPSLWLFAVFLSLYSFSYLLTNFYLSIKKVRIVSLPMAAALLQIILISLFHQNLKQAVSMSVLTTTLLLLGLLLYYLRDETRKNKEKTTLSYSPRL